MCIRDSNETAREYALAKEAQRTPPRSPPRTPPRSPPPAAATQTTPARTPPRDDVAALRRSLAGATVDSPCLKESSTAPSSPGRAELVMAIDRELRLQRRGLEEVAAGVKALVKARGLEEVKSIDLDSRSRGRQSSLEASRATETTIDTRRMAVARREADLVKALERARDPEKARRLTRDLHACRLHLRSLEFEAAARARLC